MGELRISVLDVGHGDFAYIQTPFGQSMVIDCGSGDVVPSQFLSKIPTIHELQISHPHEDHFTDLPALMKKQIFSFACPDTDMFSDDEIAWRTRDANKVAALRHLQAAIGFNANAITVGNGFSRSIWRPPIQAVDFEDPNTVSLITIVTIGATKMLFGGDLTEVGWNALMDEPAFVAAVANTTIVKVSHHGRAVGCSERLFQKIKPRLCIVSDKIIDQTNENTESIQWYCDRTIGAEFKMDDGSRKVRKVLTTRSDGSIFIAADPLTWYLRTHTAWPNDDG